MKHDEKTREKRKSILNSVHKVILHRQNTEIVDGRN